MIAVLLLVMYVVIRNYQPTDEDYGFTFKSQDND